MKYCVDCKWFRRGEYEKEAYQVRYGLCDNPRCVPPWKNEFDGTECLSGVEQEKEPPVSAVVLRKWQPGLLQRLLSTGYACGRDGRFWEPKP